MKVLKIRFNNLTLYKKNTADYLSHTDLHLLRLLSQHPYSDRPL